MTTDVAGFRLYRPGEPEAQAEIQSQEPGWMTDFGYFLMNVDRHIDLLEVGEMIVIRETADPNSDIKYVAERVEIQGFDPTDRVRKEVE